MSAKPFQVLVLGTGSHVGKSMVTAGLCRLLSERGIATAPFKAQNMALNSGVTPDGAEIGRAQLLQAEAARIVPRAEMNPVLLKPLRGGGSHVLFMGRPVGRMSTRQYFRAWPRAARVAKAAWRTLAQDVDALVMEGAGSPAEVNLARRDLANLETARFSGAPWILVADIERGGSFAQIVGTLALVPAWLRRRLLGVIINKFRGDPSLLRPGLRWLEKRERCRVLGVLPWLEGLGLDEEDSLGLGGLRRGAKGTRRLRVELLRLGSTSNFNDFAALEQDAELDLHWVRPGRSRGPAPDLIAIPGSRDSLADMAELNASGEAGRIRRAAVGGCWVLGLCGGFQMLGRSLEDRGGVDGVGRLARAEGLGLLDSATRMHARKILAKTQALANCSLGSFKLSGYQIHHGRTRLGKGCKLACADATGQPLLVQGGAGGRVWGGYLHGLLEADLFRRAFLRRIARSRGKRYFGRHDHASSRAAALERVAAHLKAHLDLGWLPEGAGR